MVGALLGDTPEAVDVALDALILLILALLVLTIDRVVQGFELALDAALYREREYQRALRDYRRLVRHRLATPLTSILGIVRLMQEQAPTGEVRETLLQTLEHEALRLKAVSLDPADELRPEERNLRPQPDLRGAPRTRP